LCAMGCGLVFKGPTREQKRMALGGADARGAAMPSRGRAAAPEKGRPGADQPPHPGPGAGLYAQSRRGPPHLVRGATPEERPLRLFASSLRSATTISADDLAARFRPG